MGFLSLDVYLVDRCGQLVKVGVDGLEIRGDGLDIAAEDGRADGSRGAQGGENEALNGRHFFVWCLEVWLGQRVVRLESDGGLKRIGRRLD